MKRAEFKNPEDGLTAVSLLTSEERGHLFYSENEGGAAIYEGPAAVIDKISGALDFGALRLAQMRTDASTRVDTAAETARLKYITPGTGQALTYQAKADEIRRYDADTNPVKADYPFLAAEIGITGPSLTAVADVVREAMALWDQKGGEIERTRLKAKADISKATKADDIEGIVSAIEWP